MKVDSVRGKVEVLLTSLPAEQQYCAHLIQVLHLRTEFGENMTIIVLMYTYILYKNALLRCVPFLPHPGGYALYICTYICRECL